MLSLIKDVIFDLIYMNVYQCKRVLPILQMCLIKIASTNQVKRAFHIANTPGQDGRYMQNDLNIYSADGHNRRSYMCCLYCRLPR